jgi:hypothetical protein
VYVGPGSGVLVGSASGPPGTCDSRKMPPAAKVVAENITIAMRILDIRLGHGWSLVLPLQVVETLCRQGSGPTIAFLTGMGYLNERISVLLLPDRDVPVVGLARGQRRAGGNVHAARRPGTTPNHPTQRAGSR